MFDTDIVQNVVMDSFKKRIWGAWQVLTGKAGIVIISISPKKFYKEANA